MLVMYEPIDPFVMQNLTEYQDKKLVSAMAAELSLDGSADSKADGKPAEVPEANRSLLEHFRQALSDQVGEVRPSKRLADSPACLVVPDGGMAPHIERMLRARGEGMPLTKRILEVNLEHPLIQKIGSLCAAEAGATGAADWIKLVYDQALLAEGSPIDDPGSFTKRMTKLMTIAAESELAHGA